MKTEDHAWRALNSHAAAQLRGGFADRVLRAAQGPSAASWRELQTHAAAQLRPGFAERVVYREFFPRGLTALDDLDEATLGTRPNLSHVTAREEVTGLLRELRLPLDERGRRRAAWPAMPWTQAWARSWD